MKENDKQPGVGIGVMLVKNGRVLLGKRHEDPEKAKSALGGEGAWTMPGGKIHFGEDLSAAAKREVYEETGMQINTRKLKILCVNSDISADAHFVTIGYLSRDFTGEARAKEPEEITEWK